jgi:hypothetical protein
MLTTLPVGRDRAPFHAPPELRWLNPAGEVVLVAFVLVGFSLAAS